MFKKTLLISAALLAALSLAGCGSKDNQAAPANNATSQNQQQTSQGINLPGDKPTYMGKVKDISDGKLVINKAELPAQPPAGQQGSNQGGQGNDQKKPGPGQGRAMKFSDKDDTIAIPSSAQIVTGNARGGNATAIKLSDIKTDQIIRVWEKDGTVTFVQVMAGNRNRPNNGQKQPNQQQPSDNSNNKTQ